MGKLRKLLVLFVLLVSAIEQPRCVFAQQELSDLIPGKTWGVPDVMSGFIMFLPDGKYQIGAYEGAGIFAQGTYFLIGGNQVTLKEPEIIQPTLEIAVSTQHWATTLWQGGLLLLYYDPQYVDLFHIGALRSKDKRLVFISQNRPPENTVVEYDGVRIVKAKATFIVEDNLIMRNKKSETNDYLTNDIVWSYGYWMSKDLRSRFLPLGYEVKTEGYTLEKETIDGRYAAWYLYSIESVAGYSHYLGWIFGGYLLPYTNELAAKYRPLLEKRIRDLGWVD
jgi:hypothetical protein